VVKQQFEIAGERKTNSEPKCTTRMGSVFRIEKVVQFSRQRFGAPVQPFLQRRSLLFQVAQGRQHW